MFYDTRIGGINWGLSWNAVVSDTLFFEAIAGQHRATEEKIPRIDVSNYRDGTTDGAWSGGVQNSFFAGAGFQQRRDDRSRDQIRVSFTWFAGRAHELKFGGAYNRVEYDIDYQVVGSSDSFCSPMWPSDELNPYYGEPYYGALEYSSQTSGLVTIQPDCDSTGDGMDDGLMMPARAGNRFRLADWGYFNSNYKNRSTGETEEASFFVQDNWQVTKSLTLSLGLRADSSTSRGNVTAVLPDRTLDFGLGDMLAPRLGFVWDPARNGRSRVFANYGRFYQSIPLTINTRSFGDEKWDSYIYYYPESGLPSTSNPGTLTYIFRSLPGETAVDPEVQPQYLEEFVFGGEYEVLPNVAVGLKYIHRWIGRVLEDISVDYGLTYFVTNPGGTYTINPGTGQPLDPPVDFAEARRDFDGVELSLTKRFSNRWQLFSSLLWSRLEGNYEGLYSRHNMQLDPNITSMFDLPHLLDNADGLLNNDREWELKIFGSYRFDFGLVAGANFFYVTGTPISKLGSDRYYGGGERFVTQRGSEGRTEDWANMDLHLSYRVPISRYGLELIVDVFNVFDNQVAVEVDQIWTNYSQRDPDPDAQTNEQWGQPLVYSTPRNVRFGIRFSW
jgi:hypothetical protein